MLYKRFYLTFIFIGALLFISQKSSGNTDILNFNKFEHITKTPKSTPQQIVNDLLINLDDNDDDDEASSKTKYRLSKTIIFSNHKSNFFKNDLKTVNLSIAGLIYHSGCYNPTSFIFTKTSISIAKRSLRI